MSITLPPVAIATWAKVEDGFYVGSRSGEFLGYVDREMISVYVATDRHSRTIGEFGSLTAAMRAVDGEPSLHQVDMEGV